MAGISQWLMLRSLKKEARRLSKEVASMYAESKARNPNASVPDIIKDMVFDKEKMNIPAASGRGIKAD